MSARRKKQGAATPCEELRRLQRVARAARAFLRELDDSNPLSPGMVITGAEGTLRRALGLPTRGER